MSDVTKKVSVIIPCYNASEYIDICWNSLKEQTIGLEKLECIFVDDCSDDDGKTLEKLIEVEKEAPESVIIIKLDENSGPGEARNIGISYAKGKYIQLFDADDELRSDALELLTNIADETGADVIQYNHLYVLGDKTRSSKDSEENRLYIIDEKADRIPFLNATKVTYGCTNKFYRLSIIKEAESAFPKNLRYEEPLFVYPIFLFAKRIYLLDEDLYIYHMHSGSMITTQLGSRLLDHPNVQLMLLEYCMSRTELYREYRDIIAVYFLWTFYCETIGFAQANKDAFLPLQYFESMQKVCRTFFADWESLPYAYLFPDSVKKVIRSIDTGFESQQELNEFIEDAGACIMTGDKE